jgi:hypothetical protein
MTYLERLIDWFATLPAEFAFLLALPFVVAIVGLLRRETPRHEAGKQHKPPRHAPRRPRPA